MNFKTIPSNTPYHKICRNDDPPEYYDDLDDEDEEEDLELPSEDEEDGISDSP